MDNFFQIYLGRILPSFFFVEMFLQVPVADFFIFLWWFISKIALYRLLFREFLGINMCLPLFLIQVSIEICLARISLEKIFG